MNTDTPRTDEAAVDVWRKSNGERMATSSDKVDADFARCLERELNEARAESIRWMAIAEGRGRTDDDEQLATAKSQLASYKARYIKLAGKYAIETHEITAQRDEARAESIRWMAIAEGRGRTDDDEQCHTCGSTSTIDNGSACAQCGCDKSLTPNAKP